MRHLLSVILTVAFVVVAATAHAGKYDALAKDFLAYLTAEKLPYSVVQQTEDTLVIAVGGGGDKMTLALENLAQHISDDVASGRSEADARAATFGSYGSMLRESAKRQVPLDLATDGPSILPRLVNAEYLRQLPTVLAKPLGGTGLRVTWVRDGERSVRYLVESDLKALGISLIDLDGLAKKNLARTTPADALRKSLQSTVAMNHGDSFDAARLLLVPDALKPGEAVVATVPHRDLLILGPVPPNDDWSPYRVAAKAIRESSAKGTPGLLDRPLRVTRDGFELK